jgi:hypothetical protein
MSRLSSPRKEAKPFTIGWRSLPPSVNKTRRPDVIRQGGLRIVPPLFIPCARVRIINVS